MNLHFLMLIVWWPGRRLNMSPGLKDIRVSETTCTECSGSSHTHVTGTGTGSVSVWSINLLCMHTHNDKGHTDCEQIRSNNK